MLDASFRVVVLMLVNVAVVVVICLLSGGVLLKLAVDLLEDLLLFLC